MPRVREAAAERVAQNDMHPARQRKQVNPYVAEHEQPDIREHHGHYQDERDERRKAGEQERGGDA